VTAAVPPAAQPAEDGAPPPVAVPERLAEIVEVARDVLESEGPEAFTMRNVAGRLGIRAPSLYKHVESKEALEALLIAEALLEQGWALRAAIRGVPGRAIPRALANAYRSWALAHPHLYRLGTEGELPRDRLPVGLEAWVAEPLVRAAGSAERARAAWAFAHGMTILELDGRFPPGADLDPAWSEGARSLIGP
jgi:AcrR family transcriptional regulator